MTYNNKKIAIARINSVLSTKSLGQEITGIRSFELSELDLNTELNFQLPTNLRLGHLAEKIVAESIKQSTNYSLLYENIQLTENKKTIGELDFLIQENSSKKIVHVELAYKFYLLDLSLDSDILNCWIGPNRNDSLNEKLIKTKIKQFPLLYTKTAEAQLEPLLTNKIEQKLCLLASFYLPLDLKINLPPIYQPFVKGHYIKWESFIEVNHIEKEYFIPNKKLWGIAPSDNVLWNKFDIIKPKLIDTIKEKRAVLCWEKAEDTFRAFFIVWW